MGLGVFYFLLLLGVGTTVFMVYGHMSVIDAFYLTVVSSSTVGYGESRRVGQSLGVAAGRNGFLHFVCDPVEGQLLYVLFL